VSLTRWEAEGEINCAEPKNSIFHIVFPDICHTFVNPKTLIFLKPMLLKELLKSKGIKQKWLADKMGVSEVTVSKWCSEKSIPHKAHLQKLSELLDVPVKAIVNI